LNVVSAFLPALSEGWEQGRKLDIAASILMTMIENAPDVVEATLAKNRAA
jgi:hypothetical protein